MPMPSSGLATLSMALNMLDDVVKGNELCNNDAESYALALNALRFYYLLAFLIPLA